MNTVGIRVALKFFMSKDSKGTQKLISRTLGKLSIINVESEIEVKDQEIWICEIEKEINTGKSKGAFIVRPISIVDNQKIRKLIPGFYSSMSYGNTIFLYPKEKPNEPWIVSTGTRKLFNKYNSIVVPVEFN